MTITNQLTIKAKKKFSQNFLIDDIFLQTIANSLPIKPNDVIVEIGAGSGNLTQYLIDKIKKLWLIEIDVDMLNHLKKKFGNDTNIKIIAGNVLDYDFHQLTNSKNIKVFGNIPYHLTSPILFHLYQQDYIKEALLLVQKEVAWRLCAKTGDKNYSRLSLISQLFAQIEYLFEIPKEAFYPKPKVDSALIYLDFKQIDYKNTKDFSEFIKICFRQKRKKLANNLKFKLKQEQFNQLKDSLQKIDFNQRAQTFSLNEYQEIFKHYQLIKQ